VADDAEVGAQAEGGRMGKRFTFSKQWQDPIKEEEGEGEEEDFCRVDCEELMTLRKGLEVVKA
jgi:hypothetical protein